MKNHEEKTTRELNRFLDAQEGVFPQALDELKRGQKKTHWIWFIFPQIQGLGRSNTARHYAIRNIDEARMFLEHPVLRQRLIDACQALLSVEGKSITEIMGFPDDMKLRSSMTLFLEASDGEKIFHEILERYFGGQSDESTLEILSGEKHQ